MLEEAALRKPGARLDVPITLGGQTFYLPKPRVRLGLRIGPDGARALDERSDLGAEFDDVLRAYTESLDDPGDNTVLAMFGVAVAMLRANYAIDDADLEGLLTFTPDDPESMKVWQSIIATARGQSPKLSGSGDDPGS